MGSNNFLEALGDLYSNVRHRVVGQFEYIVEHMFAEDFYFDAISLELMVWESKREKNLSHQAVTAGSDCEELTIFPAAITYV